MEESGTRSDVVEEALRLLEEAEKSGLDLRLLGGVAIRLRAKDDLLPVFEREYADLDWFAPKGASSEVQRFFEASGYSPQMRFNVLHGRERLLFFDERHDRRTDVFIGAFRMCHAIRPGKRLAKEPVTIPLAELLLTKLQIAELNEKDVRDALALLHNHPVGDEDGDFVNGAHIAALCANDWGLWRTLTANLDAAEERLDRYELPEEGKERIAGRIRELRERIEGESKSFSWKVRSRIGDRKRWYDLPEEVGG